MLVNAATVSANDQSLLIMTIPLQQSTLFKIVQPGGEETVFAWPGYGVIAISLYQKIGFSI